MCCMAAAAPATAAAALSGTLPCLHVSTLPHSLPSRATADTEAVQSVFGRRGGIAIAWIQYTNLWLTAIAYNIAGGTRIQEIGCMLKNEASPCGELKLWEARGRRDAALLMLYE